ncbi:MAG: hypothetical protein GY859_16870 [Desulfobacterales bacterium]|nr:hypothetical protein [Desulfobacterales bacterium]
MKQKFIFTRNISKDTLIIKEYAEMDKEMLSLLCEETYKGADLKAALDLGRPGLIKALRTRNMYPPKVYAEKIAEVVSRIYQNEINEPQELLIDDIELLKKNEEEVDDAATEMEAENAEIDDLLKDEGKEDVGDEIAIKKLSSSLKISDDEALDTDDEK